MFIVYKALDSTPGPQKKKGKRLLGIHMSEPEEAVERSQLEVLTALGYKDANSSLAVPIVLSGLEVPRAVLCLFMAPVLMAVQSYPERTKLHTECTGESLPTLPLFVR